MIPTATSLEQRITELERMVLALRAGNVLEDAALELEDGTVVTTVEMAQAPAAALSAQEIADAASAAAVQAVADAAAAYAAAEAAEAASAAVTGTAAAAQDAADTAAANAAAALSAAQAAADTGTSAQQAADAAAAAATAAQEAADAAGTTAAQADAAAAAAAATAAQAVADAAAAAAAASGAQGTASSALTLANGRNRIWTQATAPSPPAGAPHVGGDMWVDTANGRRINIWDPALSGGAGGWAPQLLSTGALTSIVASDVIVQNSVTAALIAADAISAKHTLTGPLIRTAASGARVELQSSGTGAGLKGYDPAGTVMTHLDATTGVLTAKGAVLGGLLLLADGVTTTPVGTVASNASSALATAQSKSKVYAQPSAPTGQTDADAGNLWIDIDDGNKQYRWSRDTTQTRINLVTDPQQRSGSAGYNAGGGTATLSGQLSSTTPVGTSYSRVTWSAAQTSLAAGGIFYDGRKTKQFPVKVTAGKTYTASGYVRTNRGSQVLICALHFYSAAGAQVGARVEGSPQTMVANTWARLSATGTCPAGAAYVLIAFYTHPTSGLLWASGNTEDMAGVMLEEAPAPVGTYFDGNTGGGTWQGYPDRTPSVLTTAVVLPAYQWVLQPITGQVLDLSGGGKVQTSPGPGPRFELAQDPTGYYGGLLNTYSGDGREQYSGALNLLFEEGLNQGTVIPGWDRYITRLRPPVLALDSGGGADGGLELYARSADGTLAPYMRLPGSDLSVEGEVRASNIRLSSGVDASASSVGTAIVIGQDFYDSQMGTVGLSTVIDNNEILFRRHEAAGDVIAGTVATNETWTSRVNPTTTTGWVELTPATGWTKISFQYRRFRGMVWVRGRLTRTSWTSGTNIHTGFTSASAPDAEVYAYATNGQGEVRITTAGVFETNSSGSAGIAFYFCFPMNTAWDA